MLVLTTYDARVFTIVAKLEAADRRGPGALRVPEHVLHARGRRRSTPPARRRCAGCARTEPTSRSRRGCRRAGCCTCCPGRSRERRPRRTSGCRRSPTARARRAGSRSTPSSWARAATARCCAWSSCAIARRASEERTSASWCSIRCAEDLDGSPLAEVLADPAIEIVVHAGRQDIALAAQAPADRGDATCSTRRSRPASPGSAHRSPTTRC